MKYLTRIFAFIAIALSLAFIAAPASAQTGVATIVFSTIVDTSGGAVDITKFNVHALCKSGSAAQVDIGNTPTPAAGVATTFAPPITWTPGDLISCQLRSHNIAANTDGPLSLPSTFQTTATTITFPVSFNFTSVLVQ